MKQLNKILAVLLISAFIGVNAYYETYETHRNKRDSQLKPELDIEFTFEGELHDGFPSSFMYTIEIEGVKETLQFEINKDQTNTPLFIQHHDLVKDDSHQIPQKTYHEVNGRASATLVSNEHFGDEVQTQHKFRLMVTFNHESGEIHVIPVLNTNAEGRAVLHHVVSRSVSALQAQMKEAVSDYVTEEVPQKETLLYKSLNRRDVVKRAEPVKVPVATVVDYLVVLDSDAMEWIGNIIGLNWTTNSTLVMKFTLPLIIHLINDLNQKMISVFGNDPDMTMNINLASVIACKKIMNFNNRSIVSNQEFLNITNQVLSSMVLPEFRTYTNSLAIVHDHAVLLSGNDFYSNAMSYYVVGVAYQNSICAYSRQSIVEFAGYATTQVVMHEFGHNIGAEHDDETNCSTSDGFAMNAGAGNGNLTNSYFYSNCSKNAIKANLLLNNTVINPKKMCLVTPINTTINLTQTPLPGQLYSATQQCKHWLGPGSRYCYEFINRSGTKCTTLWCYYPNATYCVSLPGKGALDGTLTCNFNSSMMCYRGQCVPKTSVLYPYTDFPSNPCAVNLCKNGGSCLANSVMTNGYVCSCPNGFTGTYCESTVSSYTAVVEV